jgi:hypothetical protein
MTSSFFYTLDVHDDLKYGCRNHSLGLVTKARACKGAGQEGRLGITSHVPGSEGECEGMNPNTPK